MAVEALNLPSVEFCEDLVQVVGDAVDEIALPRFLFGEGEAVHYPFLRQFDVTAALGHETADIGGSIVFHLLLHDFIHLAPAQGHGVSGSGVGAGGHDGQVSGQ